MKVDPQPVFGHVSAESVRNNFDSRNLHFPHHTSPLHQHPGPGPGPGPIAFAGSTRTHLPLDHNALHSLSLV